MTQNAWQFSYESRDEYSFPKHKASYANGNTFSKSWSSYTPRRWLKDDKRAYAEEERGLAVMDLTDDHMFLGQKSASWGFGFLTQ